jgi:hypothetical protein
MVINIYKKVCNERSKQEINYHVRRICDDWETVVVGGQGVTVSLAEDAEAPLGPAAVAPPARVRRGWPRELQRVQAQTRAAV